MKLPTLTRGHLAVAVAIAIAGGSIAGLSWAFSEKLALSRELRLQEERLELEVAAEEDRHEALLEQKKYVATDEYVEHWARTGPRMGRPGEVIVVLLNSNPEPEFPSPSPVGEVEMVEKPIWLELWELLVGPSDAS